MEGLERGKRRGGGRRTKILFPIDLGRGAWVFQSSLLYHRCFVNRFDLLEKMFFIFGFLVLAAYAGLPGVFGLLYSMIHVRYPSLFPFS